jgi:hypothetical protein
MASRKRYRAPWKGHWASLEKGRAGGPPCEKDLAGSKFFTNSCNEADSQNQEIKKTYHFTESDVKEIYVRYRETHYTNQGITFHKLTKYFIFPNYGDPHPLPYIYSFHKRQCWNSQWSQLHCDVKFLNIVKPYPSSAIILTTCTCIISENRQLINLQISCFQHALLHCLLPLFISIICKIIFN